LQGRDLSEATQRYYAYNVRRFFAWYKEDPAGCSEKDIIRYLDYLQNVLNMQNITRRNHLISLSHYFDFLELKQVTSFIKIRGTKRKKLHYIFSCEELDQLCDDYYHNFIQNIELTKNLSEKHRRISLLSRHRNHVMLGFLAYQGLAGGELDLLHVKDVDFLKATVKIRSKAGVRTLPLQASQIGALMNYIQSIRPQFLIGRDETGKLFLPLLEQACTGSEDTLSIDTSLCRLSKEIALLHPKFTKTAQIRASVITHWIQTEGLRRAQYLAGHRSIVSTEEYLPNDIEELIDEVDKFNPF